jgi:hypothetical protein
VTHAEAHRFLAAQHAYLAAFGPLDLADGRDAGFTVDAFEMIGLLGADEARDWRRRLARLSLEWPEKPLLPAPIREAARALHASNGDARRVLEAVGALSWRDGDARAVPELVVERVLPAPAHAASGLTVAAVVLFRDAVRFHWYAETLHGEGHGGLSLADDAGTSYERLNAISGGSGGTLVAASSFVPSPPPAATWLDVLRDGTRIVRVPLT